MAQKEQNFKNHGKWTVSFHVVFFLLVAWSVMWAGGQLLDGPLRDTSAMLTLALAAALAGLLGRQFATQNQDRIIRLEERLRMKDLLPDDLQPRIGELSTGQLVALRFASDGELADLTRKVLSEDITDRKAIKRLIREWRPDHHRV